LAQKKTSVNVYKCPSRWVLKYKIYSSIITTIFIFHVFQVPSFHPNLSVAGMFACFHFYTFSCLKKGNLETKHDRSIYN